jgi:AbrB family looped-hinge helix DNA binding protein
LTKSKILDYSFFLVITTVTGKNQITIPAKLARELAISPGTKLDWTKGEAGVLVVKIIPNRAELARRLAGRARRHLREGSVPIQDLVEDRVREDLQEGLQ